MSARRLIRRHGLGPVLVGGACLLAPGLSPVAAGSGIPEHQGAAAADCTPCHGEMAPPKGPLSPAYGPGHYDLACVDCHDLHRGTANRSLIWEEIHTPNSGVRDVLLDGVTVLLNDPAFGPSVLYDGTPDSLEAFCLACHEASSPAPLSTGNPAADVASRWAASAHRGSATCGNCHGNGHGSDREKLLVDAYVLADPVPYHREDYALTTPTAPSTGENPGS